MIAFMIKTKERNNEQKTEENYYCDIIRDVCVCVYLFCTEVNARDCVCIIDLISMFDILTSTFPT